MSKSLFFAIAMVTACVETPAEAPCSITPSVVTGNFRETLVNPSGRFNALNVQFQGACDEMWVNRFDVEFLRADSNVPYTPEHKIIGGTEPVELCNIFVCSMRSCPQGYCRDEAVERQDRGWHTLDGHGRLLNGQGPGLVSQARVDGSAVLSRIIMTPYDPKDPGPDGQWQPLRIPVRSSQSIAISGILRDDATAGVYLFRVMEIEIGNRENRYTFPRGVVRGPTFEVSNGIARQQ